MVLKVYYKDKDDKETSGLMISSHFQHNVQQTFVVVAKGDGSFDTVQLQKLRHKQEFL